jgi:hypothetical protein
MPTITAIRHSNLLLLIKEFGTIQALADKIGKSHSQLSQLRNQVVHSTTGKQRVVGDKLAREIEQKLGRPEGWMDQLHAGETPANATKGPVLVLDTSAMLSAIERLGAQLSGADEATREAIAPLLARLAREPHEAPRLGALVQRLLPDESVTPAIEAGSTERAEEWTGEDRRTHNEPVRTERRRPPLAVFDPEEMLKREAQQKKPKGPKIIGGNW